MSKRQHYNLIKRNLTSAGIEVIQEGECANGVCVLFTRAALRDLEKMRTCIVQVHGTNDMNAIIAVFRELGIGAITTVEDEFNLNIVVGK